MYYFGSLFQCLNPNEALSTISCDLVLEASLISTLCLTGKQRANNRLYIALLFVHTSHSEDGESSNDTTLLTKSTLYPFFQNVERRQSVTIANNGAKLPRINFALKVNSGCEHLGCALYLSSNPRFLPAHAHLSRYVCLPLRSCI